MTISGLAKASAEFVKPKTTRIRLLLAKIQLCGLFSHPLNCEIGQKAADSAEIAPKVESNYLLTIEFRQLSRAAPSIPASPPLQAKTTKRALIFKHIIIIIETNFTFNRVNSEFFKQRFTYFIKNYLPKNKTSF